MQITQLYIYPVKALRGISLDRAHLGPQGFRYDRRFMLFRTLPSGELKKIQLSSHPACALFSQELSYPSASEGPTDVIIRYHAPAEPLCPPSPLQAQPLSIPLVPNEEQIGEKIPINLHGSATTAYRMPAACDEWFTACFGFDCILVYLGDGRRPILGQNFIPERRGTQKEPQKGWFGTLASYVPKPWSQTDKEEEEPWITFTDCAPVLVTSEFSLQEVRSRFSPEDEVPMYKFRPNLVVGGGEDHGSDSGVDADDDGQAWAEDFWHTLEVRCSQVESEDDEAEGSDTDTDSEDGTGMNSTRRDFRLLLTANCVRCTSLNADYSTGRVAEGELGNLLKKLMKDRRVDKGSKWSPVFGRYAFLEGQDEVELRIGDEISVGSRREERAVWDWKGL